MNKKRLLFQLAVIVFSIVWIGLSFTLAVDFTKFKVNVDWLRALSAEDITSNMMYVHFADNWNDFGWFLYFSNGSWDSDTDDKLYEVGIKYNNTDKQIYECSKQIKWFYYNAERGERLWPLDDGIWQIDWLDITWGIYTNCAREWYNEELQKCTIHQDETYDNCVDRVNSSYTSDGYGYYGSLTHTYSGQDMTLVMWVRYNTGSKFVSIDPNSKFFPTFVRLQNKYPVGFIYDYNWWVWLAWCKFDPVENNSMKNLIGEVNSRWIENVFYYSGGEIKSTITGITCTGLFADTLSRIIIEWIVWMSNAWTGANTKFWLLGNSSDEKMQQIGTKSVSNTTLMNYASKKAESLCRWKWNSNPSTTNTILCISGSNATYNAITWHTMIVKKWNVVIKPGVSSNTKPYDILILDGDLIIEEQWAGQTVFTKDWFISSNDVSRFSQAVSGTIEWWNSYDWEDIAVGSFIKWNFIVNWNVIWSGNGDNTLKNKYFIYGKFTTNDTISSLEKIFSWRCSNWIGSDDNYCPKWNKYQNASLVVIDQNFDSPLIK